MSEDADYSRSSWVPDHDFSSARRAYDSHVGRSYNDAVDTGKTIKDLVPESITTEARNPLLIQVDGTGSMGSRTSVIVSKWPYLEHEAKQYLGDDTEISLASIGDANSTGGSQEDYPLVIRPFAMGKDLEKRAKELVFEGKGGSQTCETYELGALYWLHNCHMPNAVNPIGIILGDENSYDRINHSIARKYARVALQDNIDSSEVYSHLKKKMALYFIQLAYSSTSFNDPTSQEVHKGWAKLLGEDHVVQLQDPDRVVDVIYGILAKEMGKIPYFCAEIEERQRPDQVKTVYEALKTVHVDKGGKLLSSGNSTMHKSLGGKRGTRLLPPGK